MKRKTLIGLAILVFLGLAVYWSVAGQKKEVRPKFQENPYRPVPVETVRVSYGSLERRLTLTGTVSPEATVDVFSKVPGILERIDVEQGHRVRAGQVIALVEKEEREAQLQEVKAALEVLQAKWALLEAGARPEELAQAKEAVRGARAQWENSLANYERYRSLRERGFISQQALDEARLKVTVSEAEFNSAKERLSLLEKGARQEDRDALRAQIRQAESTLRLARIRLENSIIQAPIGGVIGERFLDRGAYVASNTPIVRIVAMDVVKVLVPVVEGELSSLRPGARGEIRVDAYPGMAFAGTVVRVSPTIDTKSRTADVEVQVLNPDHRLKPGMFARVHLVIQRKDRVLRIPRETLLTGDGPHRIFVLDRERASLREIRIGLEGEGTVEVLEGLEEGSEVIVAGHYELKDGMPVRVLRIREGR